MTNEQLVRQYYDGDDAALEKLYHKNIGLIRGIAKEAAAEFNCLMTDQHHPNQCIRKRFWMTFAARARWSF
jgi:hypothetical protein